ncbi:MAG: MSHA biogenesis protein MshK [Pseudomonadota bacterium]
MDDLVMAMLRRSSPLLAALSVLAGVARAQALPDPTQPPAAFGAPAAASVSAAPAGPRLQAILISKREGGRRLAVIDGKTLRVGDKFGGAVLAEVGETAVILRTGKLDKKLRLFPSANVDGASVAKP